MSVPVVVPSHKRAGKVHAMRAVSPVVLCVEEGQRDEYAEAYPGTEIVCHPNTVLGLAPKRQWMYEHFGDLFMLDDDCTDLRRLYDDEARVSRVDPADAYDIIQDTADNARSAGAKLWGLANNAIGRNYSAFHPFRTSGYVNGAFMGMFKDRWLHFPDDPTCTAEDYYVSGINAYYNRRIWADDRFGFHQLHTFANPGGQSLYRNSAAEERWKAELVRLFGSEAIVEKHMRSSSAFEVMLVVPWARGVA